VALPAHTRSTAMVGSVEVCLWGGGRHQEVGVSMEITRAFKNEQIMSITGAFGVNSTTWSNKTNVRVEVLPLVKKERSHLHKMD
jgi:hypothetical protein